MKIAIYDNRLSDTELKSIESLGIRVITCPKTNLVYDEISSHPDIQMNALSKNEIIVQKDMPNDFTKKLLDLGIKVHFSKASLGKKYPKDIILNALNTKNLFLHNLKYSDKNLLDLSNEKLKINTNQGYSKCSTVQIAESAFITSDPSIYKSLVYCKMDVLYVSSKDIILSENMYGFIGGTCGLLDKNTILFSGSLKVFSRGDEILEFLKKYNVSPIYLTNGNLIDRGSILILEV